MLPVVLIDREFLVLYLSNHLDSFKVVCYNVNGHFVKIHNISVKPLRNFWIPTTL